MTSERPPEATIFASYGYGWRIFLRYFLYLFLVGLIVSIAHLPDTLAGSGPSGSTAQSVLLQVFLMAYSFLILPVIVFGADLVTLRYVRNEESVDIREIFDGFSNDYLNIVLANLLFFAIIALGVILLIIPGIVFACRLAFVPYLVMDKRLDPVAAVEKSWNMTRGHGWRIFGMFLLAIPLCLLGLLLLGVGLFFAVLWVHIAFAALYYAVDAIEQEQLDRNGTGDPAGVSG